MFETDNSVIAKKRVANKTGEWRMNRILGNESYLRNQEILQRQPDPPTEERLHLKKEDIAPFYEDNDALIDELARARLTNSLNGARTYSEEEVGAQKEQIRGSIDEEREGRLSGLQPEEVESKKKDIENEIHEKLLLQLSEELLKISDRKGRRLGLDPAAIEDMHGFEEEKSFYEYFKMEIEGTPGPFHENYQEGRLVWRCDTRGYDDTDSVKGVGTTGLTSKFLRNNEGVANTIFFRAGGDDDILSESAVCVSEKLGGACFFPIDEPVEDTFLYAICIYEAISTKRAQIVLDKLERGKDTDWKVPERFQYDPGYAHKDRMSPVWLYGELALHRIPKEQVIAVFPVKRKLLNVREDNCDSSAGIQFDIREAVFSVEGSLLEQAMQEVEAYGRLYPIGGNQYLTYQGTVTIGTEGKTEQIPPFEDSGLQI